MTKAVSSNPLLASAAPLLTLMVNLHQIKEFDPQAVISLRQKVIEAIDQFVKHATAQSCSQRAILAARYCLCTALDEFVLASAWGNNSVWPQQTLLSIIHKETSGGERFFIILEEMSKSPKENLSLLELLYVILCLGFEGKYYCEERSVLEQIRHRLFSLLSIHRKEPEKLLSPSAEMLKNTKSHHYRPWSLLKIVSASFLILFGIGMIFNFITFLSIRAPIKELWSLADDAGKIPLPALTSPAPMPTASANRPEIIKKVTIAKSKPHHHVKYRHRSDQPGGHS